MTKFVDRAKASNVRMTKDGYMIAEAPVARTGIQQYKAKDVGLIGDHLVNVYRPEETVFAKDSLETYAGKPVTFLHPKEFVDAKNWKKYAIGEVGDDILRDGDTIRVPFMIRDQAAIDMVNGGVKQISMGYSAEIELVDGVAPDGTEYQAIQRGPLTINHLAIVPKARGGETLVIDGVDDDEWGVVPVNFRDSKKEKPMKTMLFDGLTIEVTDQAEQVINKLQERVKAMTDAAAEASTTHQKELADRDAELGKKDAEIDDLKTKVLDGAALDAAVAERSEVVAKATAIVDGFDAKGLSNDEIRKAVVVKKFGDAMAEKPNAYIEARFDMLAEDKGARKVLDAALVNNVNTKPQITDAADREAEAHAKYVASLNGAAK